MQLREPKPLRRQLPACSDDKGCLYLPFSELSVPETLKTPGESELRECKLPLVEVEETALHEKLLQGAKPQSPGGTMRRRGFSFMPALCSARLGPLTIL